MVNKKTALKTAFWSAAIVGVITWALASRINPGIVAGIATFAIGYWGMISK